MGAADRMSRSFRWPSACRGTVLLPLDMQAMLAPGDEQAARHDQRRADPRRLGGEGGEEEPAAGDRPEQRRIVHWDDHRDRRSEEHTSELQSLMRISSTFFSFKNKQIPT